MLMPGGMQQELIKFPSKFTVRLNREGFHPLWPGQLLLDLPVILYSDGKKQSGEVTKFESTAEGDLDGGRRPQRDERAAGALPAERASGR